MGDNQHCSKCGVAAEAFGLCHGHLIDFLRRAPTVATLNTATVAIERRGG